MGIKIADTHCFCVYSDINRNKALLSSLAALLTEENIRCIRISRNDCTYENIADKFSYIKNEYTESSSEKTAALIIDDLEAFLSTVYSPNNPQRLYAYAEKLFSEKSNGIMFFGGITPFADALTDRSDICFTNAFRYFISGNNGLLINIPLNEQNVFEAGDNQSESNKGCYYFNGEINKEIYIPGENDNER